MRMKVKKSIGFKMAVAMAGGLFAVISIFSHANVLLSQKRFIAMAEKEASKMSNAIKSSLDDAMLANKLSQIQAIVDAVSKEAMVEDIKIIAIDGEVRHAMATDEIGVILDRSEKSCAFCHKENQVKSDNLTVVFTQDDGRRILRNVNPIANEKRCHSCHDPADKVLGKLLVDFSTTDIDAMVSENRRLLIFSAVATLLASICICFLLATVLVKTPLHKLLIKMKYQADGNDADPDKIVEGEDEVAILDETYENMMAAIEARNRKIQKQMDEHLALFNVSEILNRSTSVEENTELILQALNIGFKIEKCAIMLLDEQDTLQTKGHIGMSEAINASLTECLMAAATKEKILAGNLFVTACEQEQIGEFLVAPLKAAKKIIGCITVHQVQERKIDDTALHQSMAIVATTIAPHYQVGISQDEKKTMQVSPFNSFLETIDNEINRVKKYFGSLSLATIRVEGYEKLCATMGVQEASSHIRKLGGQISAVLPVVHECTRISEDTLAVVLPMIDKDEAEEMLAGPIASLAKEIALHTAIASYPDNGETGTDLLFALRRK